MTNKTLKIKKKVINLYGVWHLGDAVFVMIYLYNCKDYILKNNITVNFYIKEKHVSQMRDFICCKNVKIKPILFSKKCFSDKIFGNKLPLFRDLNDLLVDQKMCDTNIPSDAINTFYGFDCLINHLLFDLNLFYHPDNKTPLNKYLSQYLSNTLGKKIGFPKMKELVYTDYDLIKRYEKFPKKYKDIDILIINSEPQSYQYDLDSNRKEFNEMIYTLSEKYNVITTNKIKNILCTQDNNFSLKDIGAISTHAKYIIAINTGPITPCLNSYAFKNFKKWFLFDVRLPLRYGKNFYINKSLDEIINTILDDK